LANNFKKLSILIQKMVKLLCGSDPITIGDSKSKLSGFNDKQNNSRLKYLLGKYHNEWKQLPTSLE